MYNPRREEANKTLPPAPQTMLQYVWQRMGEAGVSVHEEDFALIIRGVVDYLDKTGEGKRVMLKLLKASLADATYKKQYYQSGHLGDEEKQLDYQRLVEYRGWVYKGKAVPYEAVDIWDKPDLESCEMCGGLFPKTFCLITVKTTNNGKEYLENMCNHCRLRYEDAKIRDTASSKTCDSCELLTCSYNPRKQAVLGKPIAKEVPVGQPVKAANALMPLSSSRYGSV